MSIDEKLIKSITALEIYHQTTNSKLSVLEKEVSKINEVLHELADNKKEIEWLKIREAEMSGRCKDNANRIRKLEDSFLKATTIASVLATAISFIINKFI